MEDKPSEMTITSDVNGDVANETATEIAAGSGSHEEVVNEVGSTDSVQLADSSTDVHSRLSSSGDDDAKLSSGAAEADSSTVVQAGNVDVVAPAPASPKKDDAPVEETDREISETSSENVIATTVTSLGIDGSAELAEVVEEEVDRKDFNDAVVEVEEKDPREAIVEMEEKESSEGIVQVEEKDSSREGVTEDVLAGQNSEPQQPKNYKNVILEDWDFETGPGSVADVQLPPMTETTENNINNNNDNDNVDAYDNGGVVHENDVGCDRDDSLAKDTTSVPIVGDENATEPSEDLNAVKSDTQEAEASNGLNDSNAKLTEESIKPVLDKKKNPLKYSNLIVSNRDIVEILDNSVERVYRPIIPAKDIFLSIELTKHMNKSLSAKNAASDPKAPAKNNETPKVITELPKVIKATADTPVKTPDVKADNLADDKNDPSKKGKKKPGRKNINLGDEMERTIALRQLRDEFPTTRKRTHATKKVNHIPFLASSVLEKALTTANIPNKSSSGQRRRPCYLPDNAASPGKDASTKAPDADVKGKKKSKENEEGVVGQAKQDKDSHLAVSDVSKMPVPVVRTYCIKRKSTDSESDIKSALQTFSSAAKHLQDGNDAEGNQIESKPKKQKTVTGAETPKAAKTVAVTPKKSKSDAPKKRNLELEKLLGDEGAVRMLYDTQHKDDNNKLSGKKSRAKSTVGLKKDLMLKTKLVKNAVLRLSGVASDGVSLRGSRRSAKNEPETGAADGESLFLTSTPKVILYKPKKKQRAEASRILYRHSSSESFESLDGVSQRRASLESGDVVKSTNASESAVVNGDLSKEKSVGEVEEDLDGGSPSKVSRKSQSSVVGKRLKKTKESRSEKESNQRDSSVDSSNSKLTWSNVPVRKSNRPRVVSKKYSIWSSTSMDSLSVESLGLKKPKKASHELAKKLNFKEVRILQHGSLVQIVLAPSSTVLKSSFNEQVLTELKDAFDFLSEQESCSVILLTSNGTTFCQGIDLNYVLSVEEDDRKQLYGSLLKCVKQFILSLANCKKPVIAGVHASAIGLGVTLLSYCDIVMSSDTASFYTPYVKLGQMSEGAATVTFPRIHKNLVTELLFKSEKLSAAEAMKYGLVSQVIPEERFEEELMITSRRLASQSMQAMESMKLLLSQIDRDKIAKTLDMECQIVLDHWCTNECINNIIKFLNSGEIQFRHLDGT